MHWTEKPIDVISTGEILIDMMGQQMNQPISETCDFQKFLGGSPANVAFNLNTLKRNIVFVGCIGHDGLGEFIQHEFKKYHLNQDYLRQDKTYTTSTILVSKTSETPDFIPYRQADFQIIPQQFDEALLQKVKVFHTTCFALSKNPARGSILKAAKQAKGFGAHLSIDLNYSSKIWPDNDEAQTLIGKFLKLNPLLKISKDDVARLLGESLNHHEIFDYFQRKFNLNRIYLTLGSEGVKYLDEQGKIIHLPAEPILEVKDATGAGDAFWSGFLFGYTKGYAQAQCLKMGLKLAAIKLQHVGGLPEKFDLIDELIKT